MEVRGKRIKKMSEDNVGMISEDNMQKIAEDNKNLITEFSLPDNINKIKQVSKILKDNK
jgi:hypothetical protein